METILKYDRYTLVKELGDRFSKVGECFEVANILNGESFLMRDAITKTAIGVVSFDDFEKHFVKEDERKGWTDWQKFVGGYGENNVVYRSNGKKVQVRGLTDKVTAEACCCKDDAFNLTRGIYIAYTRYLIKSLTKEREKFEERVKEINSMIAENETTLKKMLNNMDK